jgi:hypothetical protein
MELIVPDTAAMDGAMLPTATAAVASPLSHVADSLIRSLWIRLTADYRPDLAGHRRAGSSRRQHAGSASEHSAERL